MVSILLSIGDKNRIVYSTTKYYVHRAYTTRHGDGPLPYETLNYSDVVKHKCSTNILNVNQGSLRYARINEDLIRYALYCDSKYLTTAYSRLLITNCDVVVNKPDIDLLIKVAVENGIEKVFYSYSDKTLDKFNEGTN